MTTNRIHAADINFNVCDSGRGKPLLLVHGFPLDHEMWQAQIDVFSATHRVIAPDLRGFGKSSGSGETFLMERFADDLAELLDAMQVVEPVTLCGLSMGGYIAWQFWQRHPTRLARLILCDTKAAADTAEAVRNRLETADRALREGADFLADAMAEKLFAPSTRSDRPELVESACQTIRKTSAATVSAALRGMARRPDVSEVLSGIEIPTLVICGRHDAISTVEEMQVIATKIPQSRFIEIPDAGHMSPMENPAAVNRAMSDFLG